MTEQATLPAVGIPHIAYYLPEKVVSVREWGQRTQQAQERIEALHANGVLCFRDAGSEWPVSMGTKAVQALLDRACLDPHEVDLLIYTHTVQSSVAPPPAGTVSLIQSACGLVKSLCFSVAQQNCVSPFMAVRVAHLLMARRPAIQRAVIVSVDLMGVAADSIRAIRDLALHSDGACAFLLERGAARNRLLGHYLYTDGRFFRGTDADNELVPDEKYYWSAFSTMRAAMQQAGLKPADLQRILPHHVNQAGWRRILSMFRLPDDKLFSRNFARIGHVFGSDPFVNFADEEKQQGAAYLLFASGLAGCYGAMVVRH